MTTYIYLLEHTTEVENEWVAVRAYADEDLANTVARKNNILTAAHFAWAVQEIELVT